MAREYEHKTRSPFFLYSLLILVGLFIGAYYLSSLWEQYERRLAVADPRPGDLFEVKNDNNPFNHFVRIYRVEGNSLFGIRSKEDYVWEGDVLSKEDHFETGDSVMLTKQALKTMFEKDSIVYLSRGR